MPIKPDTCWDVCNTPLPMPDKYLINMYLLNPIPGENWIIHVGAYYIRLTNAHDHWQMIDPPGTCWVVCNTPIPIRIKNLIPLCMMNLKPGTCWDVCNTPLPIRIKNLIPIYRMNLKPDTCLGVCNMPLPIRYKYLINTYLLNLIPSKNWIVHVVAYCIRHTNTHDHWQMIDPPGTCGSICNISLPIRDNYLINTYLLNPIPGKDWIVRVGPYCIRSTNSYDHEQMIDLPDMFRCVCNTSIPIRGKNLIPLWTMNLKPGTCWGVCNTPLPIRDKYLINMYLLNPIPGKNWIVRVGAYYIRFTNSHDHRQIIDPSGTCWGVCNTPLPIRDKYLINTYFLNPIPGKD